MLLISMGASITAQTKDGWTCLMNACSNGHRRIAQVVLAAGCDINTQTKVSQFCNISVINKCKMLELEALACQYVQGGN